MSFWYNSLEIQSQFDFIFLRGRFKRMHRSDGLTLKKEERMWKLVSSHGLLDLFNFLSLKRITSFFTAGIMGIWPVQIRCITTTCYSSISFNKWFPKPWTVVPDATLLISATLKMASLWHSVIDFLTWRWQIWEELISNRILLPLIYTAVCFALSQRAGFPRPHFLTNRLTWFVFPSANSDHFLANCSSKY